MTAVRALALVLAGAAWLACGADDDGGAGGDGGQGGGDGAAGEDGAAIDAAGPRRIADSVLFVQRGATVTIRFSDQPDGPGSCLSEPVAGCEIQTCMTGSVAPPRPDAGLVSVTPAESAGQSYLPDDGGTYPSGPAVIWEDGEPVTIAAAGAEVPAFEVELTGPADVDSVVSPPYPGPTIPRDQALLVEWTGTESLVAIAIGCQAEEFIQVRCPFPDGTTGQVPVAALQRLPACSAQLHVFSEDRRVIEPGPEWPTRVAVRGAILSTTATLQ
jgi:hypothetical protein